MSHNTHEGIRNLSPVSSISLALLFFYFITRYQHEAQLDFQEIYSRYIGGVFKCNYLFLFYNIIILSNIFHISIIVLLCRILRNWNLWLLISRERISCHGY